MKKNRNKQSVFALCLCALFSSLAVVIMAIGAVFEIADLSAGMFASLFVWLIQIEFGFSYAFSSYIVTAILSLILLPVPFPSFYFTLLFGWYPMLKYPIDKRHKNRKIRLFCKTPIIVLAVILEETLARFLLGYSKNLTITISLIIVTCFLYVFYDILLSRLAFVYFRKWRKHIFRH